MEHTSKKLFTEFAPITKEQWRAKIEKDLRGADYDEKLVWKTTEGFSVEPFYTRQDLQKTDYLKGYANAFMNTEAPEYPARNWFNLPQLDVTDLKEANREALLALNSGADGIIFNLKAGVSAENLGVLLKEIQLPYCFTGFVVAAEPLEFMQNLIKHVDNTRTDVKMVQGALMFDVANISAEELRQLFGLVVKVGKMRVRLTGSQAMQPLATDISGLLGATVDFIDKLGGQWDSETIFSKLEWAFYLTNNYFFEIARFRAARVLLHQLAGLYGAKNFGPELLKLQAITTITIDEETREDPYLNMLSNTNQAMSAIIGGCDGLTVLPHNQDLEEVDGFARRIARNVSTILKEESFFDKVADPAAGSYYLENLTDQLAHTAWEQFRERL